MINQTSAEGTAPVPEQEKQPVQQQPLLANGSHKTDDNTISSMDSALSNSDNCSDIEMGQVDAHRDRLDWAHKRSPVFVLIEPLEYWNNQI